MPEAASAAAAVFGKQLTQPWTRRQLPHSLKRALADAQASESSDTRRIFLDAGFNAWLAYFLAKESTSRNYRGKAARLETIACFEKLPEEERRSVAIDLLNTRVHETVEAQIQKLSRRQQRRRTIARTSQDPSPACSSPAMPSLSEIQRSPRTSLESLQQPLEPSRNTGVDSTMTLGEPAGGIWTGFQPVSASRELNSLAGTLGPGEQEIVSGPSNSRLPAIFPQYTCSMIRKTGDRASVTIAFPWMVGVVCLMSLSILSNKIEHLAMKIFGVHIEVENGFRYVILKDGVRLLPQPSLIIQGGDVEAVRSLIGCEVSQAVSSSPARREEINQAIVATRCVTLEISSNAQEDGVLNLNLAEEDGHQIKRTLFE